MLSLCCAGQLNQFNKTAITCTKSTLRSPDGIRTRVAGLRSQSPRPLDDGALVSFAGVPGLEPRLTEPESAGLPITPYPIKAFAQMR